MENVKKQRIKEIFKILKKAHPFIKSGNNEQQVRIVTRLQSLIDEAESLGVKKGYCEGLLFWGNDFLLMEAQRVFGIKATYKTFGSRDVDKLMKKNKVKVARVVGYKEREDGGKHFPAIEFYEGGKRHGIWGK